VSTPTVATAGLMPAGGPGIPEQAIIRSWKAPVALGIFAVLYGLLLILAPRGGETTFRLSTEADVIQLPALVVPVAATTWLCLVLVVVLAALSAYFVRRWGRSPLWIVIVAIIAFVVGFLTWAAAGESITVVGLLAGSIALAVPLIYGGSRSSASSPRWSRGCSSGSCSPRSRSSTSSIRSSWASC
jgi:hypothetical protein